jgi:hypothetical protein
MYQTGRGKSSVGGVQWLSLVVDGSRTRVDSGRPAPTIPRHSPGRPMTTITIHRTSHLKLSANHRYLLTETGAPFFWLGDVAWSLLARLGREDADHYLRTRAAQRFNVVQAALLAAPGEPLAPNAYGHLPLADGDPARPIEGWFSHVDYVVRKAASLGMYVALLPVSGGQLARFTPASAAAYGEFLAKRYREQAVIWILGGDQEAGDARHRLLWQALAAALKLHGGRQLMTFHPGTPGSSAALFHGEAWLDLNFCRGGGDADTWRMLAGDHARQPAKPVLVGESAQEDGPLPGGAGWVVADAIRRQAYWDVFAGACGHAYGNHNVSRFHAPERAATDGSRAVWRDALHHPGAEQMHFLRQLVEARPFLSRVPDQDLIVGEAFAGGDHIQATRGSDGPDGASGSYAFVYSAGGRPFTVELAKLTGSMVQATWFDPRTGRSIWLGQFPVRGQRQFTPPIAGEDWVLLLDDAARDHAQIGSADRRTSV